MHFSSLHMDALLQNNASLFQDVVNFFFMSWDAFDGWMFRIFVNFEVNLFNLKWGRVANWVLVGSRRSRSADDAHVDRRAHVQRTTHAHTRFRHSAVSFRFTWDMGFRCSQKAGTSNGVWGSNAAKSQKGRRGRGRQTAS